MALFIGGPVDGQHIEVEEKRQYIQIAVQKPLKSETGETAYPSSQMAERDLFTYKREIVTCPSKDYSIFVPQSFDCEDLLDCLVNGYKGRNAT